MTKRMKQYEVLQRASSFLKKHGCEERVAEILLQHYVQQSRSTFYAHMHEYISPNIIKKLMTDLKTHVETNIPVQHLTGYEYFYGRKFAVNEHVLIPRPETEELVKHTLDFISEIFSNEPITLVDIGTGSGVIAITLALHLSQATVYATDISKKALVVAKQNAIAHKAPVSFFCGDYGQPLIDQKLSAHIIVSNPPYIAKSELPSLSRTVKNFDPALALFADEEGTAAYRKIVEQSKDILKKSGVLAFEIGHMQGDIVRSIIKHVYPMSNVRILSDINGRDRIVIARLT